MKNKFDFTKLKEQTASLASKATDKANEVAQNLKEKGSQAMEQVDLDKVKESASNIASKASDKASEVTKSITDKGTQMMEQTVQALDANGDGKLDIEDVITLSLKTDQVRIDRSAFFKKEFQNFCPKEQILKAIDTNPSQANISPEIIDRVANEVIKAERLKVTGISAALCTPGGVAMAATIPADLVQYYGHMLRIAQKLLYLYGFPEIDILENEPLDSATMNLITLSLGAMYAVAGTDSAIKACANALSRGVSKQLMKKALTKNVIYQCVKSVSKWFGVNMTKGIFTKGIGKAIPVVGGVIGGSVSYIGFTKCCENFKKTVSETTLANPNIHLNAKEQEIFDASFAIAAE